MQIINQQLFTTEQVAKNYGLKSISTIQDHKRKHADEFIENIHYFKTIEQTKGGKQEILKWTLRGIIKIGMFIRSPQAKNFRLWAEKELEKSIKELEQQAQPQIVYMDKSAAIAIKQSEVLRSFAKDMLIADSGFFVPNAYLYAVYRYYVHTMRSTPIAMNKFFTALRYEMQKYGVRIVKAQKRLGEFKISDNLVTNKAYCTFGIKLSTTSGLECLIKGAWFLSSLNLAFCISMWVFLRSEDELENKEAMFVNTLITSFEKFLKEAGELNLDAPTLDRLYQYAKTYWSIKAPKQINEKEIALKTAKSTIEAIANLAISQKENEVAVWLGSNSDEIISVVTKK